MSSPACVKQPNKIFSKISKEALREKLWIIAALVVGAAEPIIIKYGYRSALEPFGFFLTRNLVAGLVLTPVFLYFRIKNTSGIKRAINGESIKSTALRVLPISILLMTTSFCTLLALRNLSAITVLTIVTTTPAVVALINQKLGLDILGKKFWLGFWLCFAGIIVSMPLGESFSGNWIGTTAVLIAIFSSGFYRVKMDTITRDHDPIYISACCFIIQALISLLFAPTIGKISMHDLTYGLIVGLSAAFANVAFIKALSLVGATRISIITMIQRPALILIAALILREMPTWMQAVGIVFVAVGVNFAKVKRGTPTRSVEQLVSEQASV